MYNKHFEELEEKIGIPIFNVSVGKKQFGCLPGSDLLKITKVDGPPTTKLRVPWIDHFRWQGKIHIVTKINISKHFTVSGRTDDFRDSCTGVLVESFSLGLNFKYHFDEENFKLKSIR